MTDHTEKLDGCHHDLAEKETACYDGYCPLCLARKLAELGAVVGAQAEDEGLWFVAATAPEAYLQQELRKLHAVIESGA